MFSIQAAGVRNADWTDSFIYLDGKFRFFGKQAYSSGDPVRIRVADPCAAKGATPGGKVIYKVDPVYPDEARQKKIRGSVRMLVTVATDGSVKNIQIASGSPLLVDAAKQAVMQWRYSPFMNCGQPVEMRTVEELTFPPD